MSGAKSLFFSVAVVIAALIAAPARAQTSTPEAGAQEAGDSLRIRGVVERADDTGVVVELSKGLSIRVDLPADVRAMQVRRLAADQVQAGVAVRARTRVGAASAGSPALMLAVDVLTLEGDPSFADAIDADELPARGALKSLERTGEGTVLTLVEKAAERRLQSTLETTFWRLQAASAKDIRPGQQLSVLIVRGGDGRARVERVVFGAVPAGTPLPL